MHAHACIPYICTVKSIRTGEIKLENLTHIKNSINYAMESFYRQSPEKKKEVLIYNDGICDGVFQVDREAGIELWKYYMQEYTNNNGNEYLRNLVFHEHLFPMLAEYAITDFYKHDFMKLRDMKNCYTPILLEMTEQHTHCWTTQIHISKPPKSQAYIYLMWSGGIDNEWKATTDYETACEFGKELKITERDIFTNADMIIPSVRDQWFLIDVNRRNGLDYNKFATIYAEEVSSCIRSASNTIKPKIYFDKPSNDSNQTIIYFAVTSQEIDISNRYNSRMQNCSNIVYNGGICITDNLDGTSRITSNH